MTQVWAVLIKLLISDPRIYWLGILRNTHNKYEPQPDPGPGTALHRGKWGPGGGTRKG